MRTFLIRWKIKSKLGKEWERWEEYCLTSNRQLNFDISDMDLSILKVFK